MGEPHSRPETWIVELEDRPTSGFQLNSSFRSIISINQGKWGICGGAPHTRKSLSPFFETILSGGAYRLILKKCFVFTNPNSINLTRS